MRGSLTKGMAFNSLRKADTKSKAYFALGLVCFFWGTTWIASKQGVRYMPALQLAGIRQLAGGILYAIYFLGKGRMLPRGKEWRPILILSFLNFVLANALSTWGVQYISAGLASIIAATYPLWVVVIVMINEKAALPVKVMAGFFIGFGGICLIFFEHLDDFLNLSFVFGILISFAATWAWAFGTLYTKKQAKSFNPYFSLGLQMIISGIVLLSVTSASGQSIPIAQIPLQAWLSILYLIIFSSIVTFVAFLYALQHLSAAQTSVYAYVNPVVSVLLGALFFNEKLSLMLAAGVAITLYGVYMINQLMRKNGVQNK